ncbi:hypothetical protein LOZ60_006729 [Ophidiomyces ophidiicola]|nr:hypothetical protein LOZ60_006729 [Ophidiomyces ophidiicola]KAI2142806.1 hypothetical protein LOZ27_004075 [Ophidiomyces ophidiicola]KAI2262247.1 hypothetical protein LOZ10_003485 [Ophidiomyces ophidiicola]KAI2381984.1 hypothetical protein LOY90_006621 [Ophidiomyces ophidiicola]
MQGDVSDDEISLTSTAPSEAQDEYELECVLAQRTFPTGEKYLVKWAGYPLERSTWESEDMFCDPETLVEWAQKLESISRGEEPAFDLEALEHRCLELERAASIRREKRRNKRKRLGYKVPSDDNDTDGFDFVVPDGDVEYISSSSENEKLMDKRSRLNETGKTSASSCPRTALYKSTNSAAKMNSQTSRPKPKTNTSSAIMRLPPAVDKARIFKGQKARKSLLSAISSKPTGDLFAKLSTQRRWEKALRRERTPDMNQLELRTPQAWLHSQQKSGSPPHPAVNDTDSTYSLFVEQDGDYISTARSKTANTTPKERQIEPSTRKTSYDRSAVRHQSPVGPAPTANPSSRQSFSTSNRLPPMRPGRFWNPGEVLVSLSFGAIHKDIGDVRICGLNAATIGQLLRLRMKRIIQLNFKDVCTIDEYHLLCDRRINRKYSTAWAFGFDDTSKELTAVADYLRQNDLAAIWRHPIDDIQTVFIAYPSSSTHWSFFDAGVEFPPNANLRIVARSYLPPVNTVRQTTLSSVTKENQYIRSPLIVNPHELIVTDDNPPLPEFGASTTTTSLLKNSLDLDIVTVFRDRWNITFQELSRVNSPMKDNYARAFYLFFPPEVEEEFQLMLMFLKRHTQAIFSSRLEGDWERFTDSVTTGTVLFHQSHIWYEFMPGLHKLLRKYINVFNVSLATPIKNLNYETNLQRLFPHGGVILLTQDYMVFEPAAALKIMKWFGPYLSQKYPGTWKLFFRPSVRRWLSRIFDKWPDDTMYQIYCIIEHMIPEKSHCNVYHESSPDSLDGETDDEGQSHPFVSPRSIPRYGSRTENEHEDIPKGLSQDERNTDHLVEYFAGWAICNCHKFRKFVVLSHYKPQPRWKKWQHIEPMNSQEFFRSFVENENLKRTPKQRQTSRRDANSLPPPPPPPPRHNSHPSGRIPHLPKRPSRNIS